jgi:dimethylamine/trimethylamine dehydrogenase
VEYAPVCDSDEVPAIAADIWDDADARALALTADAVHAHGALAGLELFHGGGLSVNGESRAARLAPSQQASEVQFGSLAKEMTAADIARIQHLHPARGGVPACRLRTERHGRGGVPPRLAP